MEGQMIPALCSLISAALIVMLVLDVVESVGR